jgi:hypothetical protein
MTLIQEKANQALEILKEQQTDLWLTFVRETSGVRDPALDLLIGPNDLTWPSALILTRKGTRSPSSATSKRMRSSGWMSSMRSSDTTNRSVTCCARRSPASTRTEIAVNTSRNNVHADGLTHAMHGILLEYLASTPTQTGWSAPNQSSLPCAVGRPRPNRHASAGRSRSPMRSTRRHSTLSKSA